jgi:hypothetical protein
VFTFTPRTLYPEEEPRTHCIGGWVDPRADDVEKRKFLTLPGLELRPLRRPGRSQSLYGLRFPGSFILQLIRLKLYVYSSSVPGLLYAPTTSLIILIAFGEEYKFLFMQFSPSLSYFLSLRSGLSSQNCVSIRPQSVFFP